MNTEISASEKFKKIFSRNLNDLLLEYGETQASISRSLGVSTQLVSIWCQGKSIPRIDNLQKIADYFGVSRGYFFEEE